MNPFTDRAPKRGAGGGRLLKRLAEEQPELVERVMSDAMRELFHAEGGLTGKLRVEFGENTHIMREPPATDRRNGYPLMLKLTFTNAPDEYEYPHDDSVRAVAHALQQSWEEQKSDHFPGAFRFERHGNGDYTCTVAHQNVGHLSMIVNRALRDHGLRTLDTRLMGLGENPADLGAEGRSR